MPRKKHCCGCEIHSESSLVFNIFPPSPPETISYFFSLEIKAIRTSPSKRVHLCVPLISYVKASLVKDSQDPLDLIRFQEQRLPSIAGATQMSVSCARRVPAEWQSRTLITVQQSTCDQTRAGLRPIIGCPSHYCPIDIKLSRATTWTIYIHKSKPCFIRFANITNIHDLQFLILVSRNSLGRLTLSLFKVDL